MINSQRIEDSNLSEYTSTHFGITGKPAIVLSFNNILVFLLLLASVVFFITLIKAGETSDFYLYLQNFTRYNSFYPLAIILFPLISGLLASLIGTNNRALMYILSVDTVFITYLMSFALYPQVLQEKSIYDLPMVLGYGLHFRIDMMGLFMLITSSFLWVIITIYTPYFMSAGRRNRFSLFMSITYSAVLGTIMAGDLFTFFLFFEIMTFSSYMLVVHRETEAAVSAANLYIYLGVMGGLSILLGIILLFIHTNNLEFTSMVDQIHSLGVVRYIIAALFLIGFGVKAGMVPFHVWMSNVYNESPVPANAISSGVMIKMGGYGILRLLTSIYMPSRDDISSFGNAAWEMFQNTGAVIIWLGIITMVVGVFMALQQSNMKRMLAYHSVSQMGYVIMGMGVAAYLGPKGAMGFSGGLYHMLNHSLFKTLLFLVAGAVFIRTREFNMYNLGGLWKKMPVTALLCLIASLGITGMPLFNGFASKSILHHAIDEAYHYGSAYYKYAEVLFVIVSMGTAASFIKLFGLTFLKKCPDGKYENIKGDNWLMCAAMSCLALCIIAIGLKPNFVLDNFLIPLMAYFEYDPEFIEKYIIGMHFFNAKDLKGMILPYAGGLFIFIFGMKYHLFHLKLPKWLRLEYLLFYPFYKLADYMTKKKTMDEVDNSGSDTLINKIAYALKIFTGEYEAGISRGEGLISRFRYFIGRFTSRHESSIINNDVFIYTVILTVVLIALLIWGVK